MTTSAGDPSIASVEVRLQYVADCPHRSLVEERVRDALRHAGVARADIRHECVTSDEEALRLVFRGSPTILIDGRDPFADATGVGGLSCRRYRTEHGLEGAPSVEQLVAALVER